MPEPYQSLERLKARLEYDAEDLFDERDNAAKRFDRLLGGTEAVGDGPGWQGLEAEARAIIENYASDEPFSRGEGRVDTMRATDDSSIPLVYPIQSIQQVEIKRSLRRDWEVLDADRYDNTDHRLVLAYERGRRRGTEGTRRNTVADRATRRTWVDVAAKLRVTYDRGFDPVPYDVQSVQVAIVNRMLRNLKTEQNIAAMEPDQIESVTTAEAIMTDDIRDRITSITALGGATQSI